MSNWFKKLMEEGKRRSNQYNQENNKCNCGCGCSCNNHQSTKKSNGIHLSKEEKARRRCLAMTLHNTPKKPYIYQGNEMLSVNPNDKTVTIHWNDGTITKSKAIDGDYFDVGYGILLATSKKLIKGLCIDALETILPGRFQKEGMVYILETMLLNIPGAGKKVINDIHKESRNYKKAYYNQIRSELAKSLINLLEQFK